MPVAKPCPVTCSHRQTRRVPISSASGRETRWSAQLSFHSNTRLCFPGNQDPQNRVAIGEQSIFGTVKSIFPLCRSRSCACGRRRWRHGVAGCKGRGCGMQLHLLTHSHTQLLQPPHFAQHSAQKKKIHFYLRFFSSFANFIASYHSYISFHF